MPQNAANWSMNNMRKFQKFIVTSISHFADIKTYRKGRNFHEQKFLWSSGPKLASFTELIFAIWQFILNIVKLIFVDDA